MKKKITWKEFETLFGRKHVCPDDSMAIGDDEYAIESVDEEGPTFAPDDLVEVLDIEDE